MATAPSLVGTPALAGGVTGGDPTVTKQPQIIAGDKMFVMGGSTGGSYTTPTGWLLRPESFSAQIPLFERVAVDVPGVGSEPATQQFLCNGIGTQSLILVAVRDWFGVDDIDFISVGSGAVTLPSVDSAGASRRLLNLLMRAASSTWTSAAGNEVFDGNAPTSGWGSAVGSEIVGLGPTGTRLWTPSNSAGTALGYTIAVAPIPDPSNTGAGFLSML